MRFPTLMGAAPDLPAVTGPGAGRFARRLGGRVGTSGAGVRCAVLARRVRSRERVGSTLGALLREGGRRPVDGPGVDRSWSSGRESRAGMGVRVAERRAREVSGVETRGGEAAEGRADGFFESPRRIFLSLVGGRMGVEDLRGGEARRGMLVVVVIVVADALPDAEPSATGETSMVALVRFDD